MNIAKKMDTMCLDTGSYMMNFAGCAQCQACEPIKVVNVQRTEDEDNDEELVTFQHVCHECEHVIANHEYTFRVVDEYQVYQMYCALCGHGEDERSIMPCDPRGPKE
ncbi:hypothetical protein ACJMK2_038217 [Sinanodonta woodiana]|uniref:Protein Churchill n=1 Tax=Sinanodonta woodiana TaxID=1069815 RepID=A0ABD3WPA0_SINWO